MQIIYYIFLSHNTICPPHLIHEAAVSMRLCRIQYYYFNRFSIHGSNISIRGHESCTYTLCACASRVVGRPTTKRRTTAVGLWCMGGSASTQITWRRGGCVLQRDRVREFLIFATRIIDIDCIAHRNLLISE